MAKGQHLSSYQRGIVKRYYEHIDTIALQKLGEVVSDLYLADPKKAGKLWEHARTALQKTGADAKDYEKIVSARDLQGLARLVNELSGGGRR